MSNFNYSVDRSDSAGQTAAIIGLIVAYAAIFAFVILYQVLFLRSRWQATPGKRLLGLHIVTLSGEPVSGWRALGRYLCYAVSSSILCIGFMMAGWTKEKRAFHDSICDTRVVHGRL